MHTFQFCVFYLNGDMEIKELGQLEKSLNLKAGTVRSESEEGYFHYGKVQANSEAEARERLEKYFVEPEPSEPGPTLEQ